MQDNNSEYSFQKGPLVFQDINTKLWYLAGTSSFTAGGLPAGGPCSDGMFAKVANYFDWIGQTMRQYS
jgi:hypothetical protein